MYECMYVCLVVGRVCTVVDVYVCMYKDMFERMYVCKAVVRVGKYVVVYVGM
ncbi:hypothetical protein HanRHA438_Chr14g0653241 [Helianthus annuus]|nr:hypothetical protein HanRHA438_Chr14g0653241 [Helianthus annuus]